MSYQTSRSIAICLSRRFHRNQTSEYAFHSDGVRLLHILYTAQYRWKEDLTTGGFDQWGTFTLVMTQKYQHKYLAWARPVHHFVDNETVSTRPLLLIERVRRTGIKMNAQHTEYCCEPQNRFPVPRRAADHVTCKLSSRGLTSLRSRASRPVNVSPTSNMLGRSDGRSHSSVCFQCVGLDAGPVENQLEVGCTRSSPSRATLST